MTEAPSDLKSGDLVIGFASGYKFRTVTEGEFSIGRNPDCYVWMGDISTSGLHACVLTRKSGSGGIQWGVEDKSRHGTWIKKGKVRLGIDVHWFDSSVDLRLYDPDDGPRIKLDIYSPTTGTKGETPLPSPFAGKFTPDQETILAGFRAGLKPGDMAGVLEIHKESVEKNILRLRKKIKKIDPTQGTDGRHLVEIADQLGIAPLATDRRS
jgi:FHA domain